MQRSNITKCIYLIEIAGTIRAAANFVVFVMLLPTMFVVAKAVEEFQYGDTVHMAAPLLCLALTSACGLLAIVVPSSKACAAMLIVSALDKSAVSLPMKIIQLASDWASRLEDKNEKAKH